MIGLFGLYNFDRNAPADPREMAARLPDRLHVVAQPAAGAAVGRATHGETGYSVASHGERNAVAHVCGWIGNPRDFDIPNRPEPTAADIVLHLVLGGDTNGLGRINGQFCAVVYDAKAHSLFMVTDRNGTFPLFYWADDKGLAFASQLYALSGLARIPKTVDTAAIAELFTMQRTIGSNTPIAGVKALSSASIVRFDASGLHQNKYWQLAWEDGYASKADCADDLSHAVRTAVRRQADMAKHPGLMLSGGLDSRMIISCADPGALSCWTTASYEENLEMSLAKRVAGMFDAEHHVCIVSPEDSFRFLDDAVIACGGLYPASTPIAAFMPQIDPSVDMLLTGHGLDYTLRGYYLPSKFLSMAGSKTRLPALRGIPQSPTGHDVLASLRQGPPRQILERMVPANRRELWWDAIGEKLDGLLEPWLKSDQPYNAWDAFILENVSKHYAFTGMMAVRNQSNLANPAFDNDVFDIYLKMPPAWRCEGWAAVKAMRQLSKQASGVENANTGFAADLYPWLEITGLVGRGVMRRLKILRRPELPSEAHSQGSWQNIGALIRNDPWLRSRVVDIQGRLDSLCFGIMDATVLSQYIDEHLDGRKEHTKLLRQLLTHDSWVQSFGMVGHD